MTTDEETAKALARWLEQAPGSPPPAELDRGVVEAVYALRPDLAPAPRLTADDILGTVTRGPLAGLPRTPVAAPRAGEVVAFPGDFGSADGTVDSDPERASGRRHPRWWWWAGGTGGVGLALAAAATLTLIALPEMPTGVGPAASESLLSRERAAEPASSAYSTPLDALGEKKKEADEGFAEPTPVARQQPSIQAAAPPPPPPAEMTGLDGAERRDAPAPIPEVAVGRANAVPEQEQDLSASNAAPASAPAKSSVASEDERRKESNELAKMAEVESAPQAAAGGLAAPAEESVSGGGDTWRSTADDSTLDRVDDALERAAKVRAKDPAKAAAILAEVVGPPAAVGQHVAALAAEDYLRAGDADAAEAVARQGLALSDDASIERSRLLELEQEAQSAE